MSDSDPTPSSILLDEYLSVGDDRFLEELTRFKSPQKLLSIVEKWKADPRPWAREMVMRYIGGQLDRPGHEVIAKRMYKHFEEQADHEVMAHFMVALDRLVRRRRVQRGHYDYRTRQFWSDEVLFAKPNKTIEEKPARWETYKWGRREHRYQVPAVVNRPENRLFSHRTRNYLRRRVWRYFRYLSYRDADAYRSAMVAALRLYSDADFEAGENIIDNWSLMHACYFHHEVIEFGVAHARLAKGGALSDLTPAPYQPDAWKSDAGAAALIELVGEAGSALVRLWALELLQRDHPEAIRQMDVQTVIRLLSHPDERVQQFAAELFAKLDSLASLRIETWLELLDQANLSVLSLLCDAMSEHVSPDRLDGDQMVQLTCARQVPVAQMALALVQQRHDTQPLAGAQIARLADAQCEALAGEIATWALGIVGADDAYDLEAVIGFFDALQQPTRASAMAWLGAEGCPGYDDPRLWARLIETPFDDVRLQLVEMLETRLRVPGQQAGALQHIWMSVVLGVHRGGRTKPKAVRQVAQVIGDDPARAERFAPVLAVAVRSIRGPERRAALAAVAGLVCQQPQLGATFAQALPELTWPEAETEAGP